MEHQDRKKILWVGDACVSTGFARATHKILEAFVKAGCEIHVLGINYTGDSNHGYPYTVYTCYPGGDYFGIGRIGRLAKALQPDLIFIQQDPWNFPQYLENLEKCEMNHVPVIGVVAVDSKLCQGFALNDLAAAIFWTKFGARQAVLGGYNGSSSEIPLGVDLNIYKPLDRQQVREEILAPTLAQYGLSPDSYIVGFVGRNQVRKRLDLTIQYFAEWVLSRDVRDACLWLHCAPTGDDAFDLKRLAEYFGIKGRVLVPELNPTYGVTETLMAKIYNLFDVFFTTTLGEGWCFPVMEAMACGTPCVVPEWSALREWPENAVIKVPCTSVAVAPGFNTVGGVMDKDQAIAMLDQFYRRKDLREAYSQRGLELVSRPQFRWEDIGKRYVKIADFAIADRKESDRIAFAAEAARVERARLEALANENAQQIAEPILD